MEKTLTIDGKAVRFKSTGATPLRYKAQFQQDYFKEILKMGAIEKLGKLNLKNMKSIKPEDLEGLDFEVFYNIAWTLAKTADKDVPDPITWLDTFETFPMMEVIPELTELITASLQTKKK